MNSLFIALGSNLEHRKTHLDLAKLELCHHFELIAESRIYESKAVDFINQPDFFNQVIEFKSPALHPLQVMEILLFIEQRLGRTRERAKGPRTIDLDLLFFGREIFQSEKLILPHPRLFERSFVILPLKELPGFKELEHFFDFNHPLSNTATPIN